jgi:hypothetical protein
MFLFLRAQQRAGGSEPADQVAQGRKNSRPGGKSCGQPAIVIWNTGRRRGSWQRSSWRATACSCLAGGCTVVECTGSFGGEWRGACGAVRAACCKGLRIARIQIQTAAPSFSTIYLKVCKLPASAPLQPTHWFIRSGS